jgi:hypothetical protein
VSLTIALDHYVYEDVYPAFKAATDEKEITAKINRAFLNYLVQRNQTLTGDAPLAVADIYFVVQRAPLEFAADHSATGLATYIDEIRRVIDANGDALPSAEKMQVFCRADAAPPLRESIHSAVAVSIASKDR